MCPLDIVPQSGPKGKCCPGKAKKDLPFSTNGPVYPVWEDACPLRLAMGKPPPPRGEASFSILPWGGRFVSRESRMACPKLWVERALALSGLPMANHLPLWGRRVFASCRGFAGLFHVKHARLVLSRGREKALVLSGLPMASHLPQRGRRVFASCRGFSGLFHVKHGLACLKLWAEKERLPSPACLWQATSPRGGGKFSRPAAGLLVCFT